MPAPPLLSHLPTFEGDDLQAVIETPKGSRNKYGYDDAIGTFRFKTVLPEGLSFPYDFGLIPSTKGEDGDPLDILLLLDASAYPGCVVAVRLVGVIEAEQREGDAWARNDRFVGVATHARTHGHIRSLDDLRPGMLEEIEAFFAQYNRLADRDFRVTRRSDAQTALRLICEGMAAFGQGTGQEIGQEPG